MQLAGPEDAQLETERMVSEFRGGVLAADLDAPEFG